jgi:hypothetical protein
VGSREGMNTVTEKKMWAADGTLITILNSPAELTQLSITARKLIQNIFHVTRLVTILHMFKLSTAGSVPFIIGIVFLHGCYTSLIQPTGLGFNM